MFHRVVSDSESVFEKMSVSENESFIDFVNNNVHLLDEQSASVNLSNDVSVTATAINIQPSFVSETVLDSLTVPAMSESKERGKALKSDFKLMYADFHIAGYLL